MDNYCYINFINEVMYKINNKKNISNDFYIALIAQKYNIDYKTILLLNNQYNICYYNPFYTIHDYLIKNKKGEYLINLYKLI